MELKEGSYSFEFIRLLTEHLWIVFPRFLLLWNTGECPIRRKKQTIFFITRYKTRLNILIRYKFTEWSVGNMTERLCWSCVESFAQGISALCTPLVGKGIRRGWMHSHTAPKHSLPWVTDHDGCKRGAVWAWSALLGKKVVLSFSDWVKLHLRQEKGGLEFPVWYSVWDDRGKEKLHQKWGVYFYGTKYVQNSSM